MIDFILEFNKKIRSHALTFDVRGIVTRDGNIYQLGSDTKVLSSVFELIVRPLIIEIAKDHGLVVCEPPVQNSYPDFTLISSAADFNKVAVDVKTTYRHFRRDTTWTAAFTLGGYTSFLRRETKNIVFPYSQYAKHYVIGFIYSRSLANDVATDAELAVTDIDQRIFTVAQLASIPSPIQDIEFFVQEKHRIAADHPGSGNTTNIASITTSSAADFALGNGHFATLVP